ncbi:RDD family protein [Hyphomonas sp.]|uniref:RDD family protein n=1 Tax=Hyphomonas sp. TaxID=87 RepID=UPI0030031F40
MSTSPDIDVFGEAPEGEHPRIDLTAEHKPRIWARFLAKWIDFYLCLIPSFVIMMGLIFLYSFVATLLAWPVDETIFDGYILVGVFLMFHALTFTVLEAFCVSQFGNTPGKALMGIRIRNIIGSRLSFRSSLKRSALAMLAGMGLGIPLISLITQFICARTLSEDGYVFWDRVDSLQYQTQVVGAWRWIFALVIYIVCRTLDLAMNYL